MTDKTKLTAKYYPVCTGILSFLASAGILSLLLSGCTGPRPSPSDNLKTELSESVAAGKIMFGQQDALLYGREWFPVAEGFSADRSDVKDVCGRHPKVLGLDLGGIENGDSCNLDNVSFGMMAEAAVSHYLDGGIVTVSWHIRNPQTGGDSWDVSSEGAVASVLEGGENHSKFITWLERAACFLSSFKTAGGEAFPVILRLWHEHTGDWFWWGDAHCSDSEYKELWKLVYRYFAVEKGMDNIVWAYSPNMGVDKSGYMAKYPGDEYVDIMGLDAYQYDRDGFIRDLKESLAFMSELGAGHGKMIALTETGCEGVPDENWWTSVLYPCIVDYPVAYVLVWRNAYMKDNHFFGPWPGAVSAADFRKFAESDKMVLR